MQVLYLDTGFDSTSEFFRIQRESVAGCTNQCLYKNSRKGVGIKALLAIGIYLFPPILYSLYGSWKKELEQYDMFIVASRRSAKYAIKYIKKKTKKRVVVWYWNLVTYKEMNPSYCKKNGCEVWSFDKDDCEKYKMKFGDTYYFPISRNGFGSEHKHSVFYVGINRPGRKEFLDKIGEYLGENGLNYRFNLTAIPGDLTNSKGHFSPRMHYKEVIKSIENSAAVLDLNRENQSGMTLRPMEALFFRKKLITNNVNIPRYSIYDEQNTYIVKDERFEGLADFLKTPYVESKENEIKRHAYCFGTWLERIIADCEAR